MAAKTGRRRGVNRRKIRMAQPGYGSGTARSTGTAGAARYRQLGFQPKERSGPAVIVVNPGNPQQGRIVKVGKRGGAYGQGGSAKSRWGDLKTLTSALPAAMVAVPVLGAGFVALKNSEFGRNISKKLPGGSTTLGFIAGGTTAYLAYRYKSLIAFLAGLGLAAWAVLKFSTGESKLSEYGDDEFEPDTTDPSTARPKEGGAATSPRQRQPKTRADEVPAAVTQSVESKAKEYLKAGHAAFERKDYQTAVKEYGRGFKVMPDPVFIYNAGRAYHKDAEQFVDSKPAVARDFAQNADMEYLAFLDYIERQGKSSKLVGLSQLEKLIDNAKKFHSDITLFLDLPEQAPRDDRRPADEGHEGGVAMRGVVDMANIGDLDGGDYDRSGYPDGLQGDADPYYYIGEAPILYSE